MRSLACRNLLLLSGLVAFAVARPVAGQCTTGWSSADAWPGVAGTNVFASTMWDPDGSGPLAPRLVLGGQFHFAGSGPASNIAMFDPTTNVWSPLGTGTNGAVRAFLPLPNGDLVVGGDFTIAGGVATCGVARWNGSTWSPIGPANPISGTSSYSTRALVSLPNGDLVAGGGRMDWGGAVYGAMRWNGSSWSDFGFIRGGSGTIEAMRILSNGDLVIAGGFAYIGGQSIDRIARWNGVSWSGFGAGGPINRVYGLAVMPNGDICVGGAYTVASGSKVLRWNGVAWSQLGSGMDGQINALFVQANGDLVATGGFTTAGGIAASSIARWNGATWSPFGTGLVNAVGQTLLELPGGELVGGGSVPTGVVRWNGSTWRSFGGRGLDGSFVSCLTTLPDGDVVAGGYFVSADDGVVVNRIARSDGTSWSPLGAGSTTPVFAVTSLPDGDVIASGSFATPTGTHGIARWNGASWTGLGAVTGEVYRLVTTGNGDVFAVGSSNLAIGGVALHGVGKWDGSTWSAVGNGIGFNHHVYAVAALPNGDVVVGGPFTVAGGTPAGRIARWDGTSWQPLGTGTNNAVLDLAVLPNGDLIAAGDFTVAGGTPVGYVARWNGSTWSGLGTGTNARVRAVLVLPDDDIVAGGDFATAGGNAADRIARWNGSTWSPFGSGLGSGLGPFVYPSCTSLSGPSATGIAVGGSFNVANGRVALGIARVVTTCPAGSSPFGSGCASSGGRNVLVATTLPWVDATFRATGTGLPTNALVFTVTSFASVPQGVAPLATIFAEGIPGCDVLVVPDILGASLTSTGVATSSFLLPSAPPIVGVTFFHQMIPFEIGGSGVVAITATNALQLTAGTF